jgi:hypothetical protein
MSGCIIQGGSNMTGTDFFVNKPHLTCASKCLVIMVLKKKKSVPVIFEPPCTAVSGSFERLVISLQK